MQTDMQTFKLGVVLEAKPPPRNRKKALLLRIIPRSLELGGFFETTLAPENGCEIWNVEC
jgi:hypothetical protein